MASLSSYCVIFALLVAFVYGYSSPSSLIPEKPPLGAVGYAPAYGTAYGTGYGTQYVAVPVYRYARYYYYY